MLFITLLLIQAVLGTVSAVIASRKNRSFLGWYLMGAFLGPVGIMGAMIATPVPKEE